MDLIKVMFFGGSRSGVVAGRRVLAVESTFVVGGRRVSVAGEQSWSFGRHGCGWLAEQGCDRGVEAPGHTTCLVRAPAVGDGVRGRHVPPCRLRRGAPSPFV